MRLSEVMDDDAASSHVDWNKLAEADNSQSRLSLIAFELELFSTRRISELSHHCAWFKSGSKRSLISENWKITRKLFEI